MYDNPNVLIGRTIKRIFMNEDFLKFETDGGDFTFTVEGDCCSRSVFYDFMGVKHLLNNGPIVSVKDVNLEPTDIVPGERGEKDRKSEHDDIKVYGFALTTVHPEFGEVTSVFSFRNYSNGYYGGWMDLTENRDIFPEITDDVIETVPPPANA